MNIRFSDATLRCRVKHEELHQLLNGRALVLEVHLPRGQIFRASVRPVLTHLWQLDSDPTGLWICIPKEDLQLLAESLPSRQGIEHAFVTAEGRSLKVSFEVDVRQERRPARHAPPEAARGNS